MFSVGRDSHIVPHESIKPTFLMTNALNAPSSETAILKMILQPVMVAKSSTGRVCCVLL